MPPLGATLLCFGLRSLPPVTVSCLGGRLPSRSIYHPTEEELSEARDGSVVRNQPAIPDDLDLSPSTHMVIHNVCNSSSRGLNVSPGFQWYCMHGQTDRHAGKVIMHIKINRSLFIFLQK